MITAIKPLLRVIATLGILGGGVALGTKLWQHYMDEPWTRDGRVRAEIVSIAPDVSGRIIDLKVIDNQYVQKGDVLYVIDQADYRLNVATAQALADTRKQDLVVKAADAERREKVTLNLGVSVEELGRFRGSAAMARAAYEEALAGLGTSKLNLERTTVRVPVNGYVTNLGLRVGDYATKGAANIAIVDSDSFWIAGYFEETKIAGIHVGDRAAAVLLGFNTPVTGHVESISRGISDQNDAANGKGLANINPVFSWVRLAQRIPVRIHIDEVPAGVELAAGMTCTVAVGSVLPAQSQPNSLLSRVSAF